MVNCDRPEGDNPRILITGASGFLGETLCRMASADWSVYGVCHRHPLVLPGVSAIQADLIDFKATRELMAAIEPQAVIHAAAIAQPGECEKNPQLSEVVNVRLPEMLAGWCAQRRIPLVFTSTDLVFDGLHAPYAEHHPVTPLCVYARHKARAEGAVLKLYPGALVCRLPLMFGTAAYAAQNFTMQMLTAMAQGCPVRLFTDEFRTPVDNQSAARGLLTLLGKARGVLHLGGRTRISRYEMGLMMANQLGVDPGLAQPVTIGSAVLSMARSPDCALVSRRAYRLGYDPAPLSAAVQRVVGRFKIISTV